MIKRIALFAIPLLAACAIMGNTAPSLAGSKWSFDTIDGRAPVSRETHLSIEADRIGAGVGCNGMGGDLKIEPGKLVTGPMISTQMYCENVMDQESAVAQMLSASPSYVLTKDRLILTGGGHRAELRRVN
jgi:heat shock protein HslJ